jgi:5-methylthioribose kinase
MSVKSVKIPKTITKYAIAKIVRELGDGYYNLIMMFIAKVNDKILCCKQLPEVHESFHSGNK